MSVVGIDFGNDSCFVAVARQGGIETVDNDYSLRSTPSCVAFNDKQRLLGVAAKNQLITNLTNTVFDFKGFIGRDFNDPIVRELANGKSYKVVPFENGNRAGVEVNYLGKPTVFNFEQITAMLFTKLKETTEHAISTKVSDCVVSVPSYFTNTEREALLEACSMAGLNCLRLMNDTTASGLTYLFYHQDLPAVEEPARHVAFVDCGHSSLQVFIAAFNKGKMKVLATAADPSVGGKHFDSIIASHFAKEFQDKYKLNAYTNARAYIRLLAEVEKLKKQMSANSTKLPLNIECFMNDVDVSSSMCRADFEALAAPLFSRVEKVLVRCLQESGLQAADIHSVEIIGGAARIPAIKQLISTVFQKAPSTTLNQDEAVARGCAIQCALLSPTFKAREVKIEDSQPYPIKLIFDESLGEDGQMPIFPRFHTVPFAKKITFYKRKPFTLKAVYDSNDVPYPTKEIGVYEIPVNTLTPEEESLEVKVKVKLDINGIFRIPMATGYEKLPEQIEEASEAEPVEHTNGTPMEVDATPSQSDSQLDNNKMDEQSSDNNPTAEEGTVPEAENKAAENAVNGNQNVTEPKKPEAKKQKFKTIDLPVNASCNRRTPDQLNVLIQAEAEMVANDRKEKARIDAKNALEEYVYALRSKLSEEYKDFVSEEEKNKMIKSLDEAENWLYDEADDHERYVFAKKLEELKKFGDGVQQKLDDFRRKLWEEEQAKLKPPEPEVTVEEPSEGNPEPQKIEVEEGKTQA